MKKGLIAGAVVVLVIAGIAAAVVTMNKNNGAGTSTTTHDKTSGTTPPTTPSSSNQNNMSNMNNGSSNSSNGTGSNTSSTTPVATNAVNIKDFAYSPANITVKKGTAVTWTNNDSAQHTVTSTDGDVLHSEPLKQGDSFTYTFNTVGTFTYHCTFHSNMTGTVTVTE